MRAIKIGWRAYPVRLVRLMSSVQSKLNRMGLVTARSSALFAPFLHGRRHDVHLRGSMDLRQEPMPAIADDDMICARGGSKFSVFPDDSFLAFAFLHNGIHQHGSTESTLVC